MKSTSRLTQWALRTYPRWWRERYRDEVRDVGESLIIDGRRASRVALNLVAGAPSAWLWGVGAPRSREFWFSHAQRALTVNAATWFAAVPLGLTYLLHVEQLGVSHSPGSIALSRAGGLARSLQVSALLVLCVGVVVVVVGWSRLREALEGQALSMVEFRLVNGAAMVGVTAIGAALFLAQHSATSYAALVVARTGGGLLILGWVLMPWGIARWLRRGSLSPTSLRREVAASHSLAGVIGLFVLLVVAVSAATALQPTPPPGTNYLIVVSTLGVWWPAVAASLVAVATTTVLSARVARYAYERGVDA